MLSKSSLKFIRSLRLSKFRNQEKLFTIEGDKMVKEALSPLTNPNFKIHSIYAVKSWIDNNEELIRPFQEITHDISEKELSQISNLKNPNQVFALIHDDLPKTLLSGLDKRLIIALDDVQDPGNMGTIFRTADWFGINDIILSERCADPMNPKVVQASMGSIFRLNYYSTPLEPWLANLPKGTPVYGAILEGENIYDQQLTDHGVILMGNESKGIDSELEEFINYPLTIPKVKKLEPGPESLNVSVALGIILSEFTRQSS